MLMGVFSVLAWVFLALRGKGYCLSLADVVLHSIHIQYKIKGSINMCHVP